MTNPTSQSLHRITLDVRELSLVLGVPVKTIQNRISDPRREPWPISSAVIGGKRMFLVSDVEKWLSDIFGRPVSLKDLSSAEDATPKAQSQPEPPKRRRGRPRLIASQGVSQ